ncbi:Hypothetical predicted protein [Marmota monax]|uniref:Small ribosomal subunit protein uS13 n=1 Tax=Marmota monax TaxID=9995 RepID=A0A5E4CSH4_MARMO|nr:Hypothetical predicted protein [Marmota monax]
MSLVITEKFQHILRVLNTNINGQQKIAFAITVFKGVGRRYAHVVLRNADTDLTKRAGELTEDEVEHVTTIMQNPRQYKIPDWVLNRQKDRKDGKYSQVLANGLDNKLQEDLEQLKKIRANRGLRYFWGLRVQTDYSGSVPECFLEPALIRAYTEHRAAEFRLPELPWPRAKEPAETTSWSLLLSENTPSTERLSSGSWNCPGPGLRSPRKLLLGPGPAEGRSGLTRCFGYPEKGTKCCHLHRIPTWQRSDVIRKRRRRELHQYQRQQKQLVSW